MIWAKEFYIKRKKDLLVGGGNFFKNYFMLKLGVLAETLNIVIK